MHSYSQNTLYVFMLHIRSGGLEHVVHAFSYVYVLICFVLVYKYLWRNTWQIFKTKKSFEELIEVLIVVIDQVVSEITSKVL